MMFSQLTESLESTLKNLRGQGTLSEENVADSLREVRRAFLEADVSFNVTRDFVKAVKEKAMGREVLTSVTPGQQIVKIIHDELVQVMGGETRELALSGKPPVGIMMVGLQGSGKTTFAAKISLYLRSKRKKKPLLVAADVYRPAAIKQLQVLGKSIGIPVYDEGEGNPVEIIKHGYEYAEQNGFDVVIYDTAGRLQIDEKLMQELEQAREAVHPEEILFVADAMIGQEAVNVAQTFFDRLNFTGVCLSKMDGDARGGAALSIKRSTGVPICFIGVGEKPNEIDLFHPDRMASRILGMGDVVSLVEKAQSVIDERDAKDLKKKILNNTFDLDDFLRQLRTIKKLGRIKDILGLIPGLNKLPLDKINEKEMVYVEAVLSSMTEKERKHPNIINGSRKARIAKGSGTEAARVNQVLRQFEEMKEMFKKIGAFAKKQNGGNPVGSNYTPPKKKKKKR
ncbi:signal recognition particle protein [Fibrobacter intestinalis]|uniref:Signal recognition particle protein n=1 Tax=Fibrobacter intestinalis TaxID=28122 RepID=A0A1T4N0W6_9BACT|nr:MULTISPECIES: signal recognition particle protein [Fibrobacter]PBC75116.1 signal recognition particle subunit FFH/SRP54 (srp54) [Fibrobacter sp. NR9]SJZ72771.1 signal recognition particle subunit FFH/SRP54 (srp54) [Fibrobacter intestinalis]